jgi:hypothetical protein
LYHEVVPGCNNDFFVLQKDAEKVNDVAVKTEEKAATLKVSACTVINKRILNSNVW